MASTTPISAMVSTVGPKATREAPQPLEQATGRNPNSRDSSNRKDDYSDEQNTKFLHFYFSWI